MDQDESGAVSFSQKAIGNLRGAIGIWSFSKFQDLNNHTLILVYIHKDLLMIRDFTHMANQKVQ